MQSFRQPEACLHHLQMGKTSNGRPPYVHTYSEGCPPPPNSSLIPLLKVANETGRHCTSYVFKNKNRDITVLIENFKIPSRKNEFSKNYGQDFCSWKSIFGPHSIWTQRVPVIELMQKFRILYQIITSQF